MRVLSWNLWWKFGDWQERRHAILAVLRDAGADLIGLQEVWADGDENLAEWLADELGLHWTFEPSTAPEYWQRRLDDSTVSIGNAVLSRWPLDDRAVRQLPGADGRSVLGVLTDGIPFFTTHLSAPIDASAARCEQVRELAAFVASRGSRSRR